jgi:hypothetical protein
VLIRGHLRDEAWQATAKWTDDYLIEHAVCIPYIMLSENYT